MSFRSSFMTTGSVVRAFWSLMRVLATIEHNRIGFKDIHYDMSIGFVCFEVFRNSL